jgi:hypothetical protein
MSNINISRAVDNIRASTTVYTPLVEVIVNSIQAIDSSRVSKGIVAIRVHRDAQLEADGGLSEIDGFEIEDNGIGFTDEHRESFDTLYGDLKISEGGVVSQFEVKAGFDFGRSISTIRPTNAYVAAFARRTQ